MSTTAPPRPDTRRLLRVPDVSLRSSWRLWQRNATIYKHTFKLNIVPNFFEPFLYLLAMGIGLGAYLRTIGGVRYIDFIAPGLAASSAMFGASFETTFNAFVKLKFGKIYDAVMATPLSVEDIGVGEILWATTRALIYGAAFLLIAAAFGLVHSSLVILTPVGLALIGAMFAVIGLIFTALVPLIDYFSYYWTLFLTPMFLFSGIFFPLERLPDWVSAVAWWVPLHQAVELMRALVLTGDLKAAAAAAAWIAVASAVLFVIPLNLLRRRLVT